LVPLPAQVAGHLAVGVLTASEKVERLIERSLHISRGVLCSGELCFGAGGLGGDAVLLLVEQVEGMAPW
jgi:hypothetical protein